MRGVHQWCMVLRMNTTHQNRALDHLDAVEAYADSLSEEWAKDRPDAQDVKFLTASIGRGLKLAEIHALLNIGDQIARLADHLEDDDLIDFIAATPRVHTHAPGAGPVFGCQGCLA